MMWIWPMHFATKRHAHKQFCYFYQLNHPDLRGGIFLDEWCANG